MALTKEQLFKRRLTILFGYNEGKYDLQDLVDVAISCINAEGEENVSNENEVKLVQESIHSFTSNPDDLQDINFYGNLIRKNYQDELLVPVNIAETVAALMLDQFSKNKDKTGISMTGQEILNNLSDETY